MKKGRAHLVPLSCKSLEIIHEISELRQDSPLLFPGRIRNTQPISDVALIKAVKRFTDSKATPHGFRHTASTILNERGYNRDHIEMQLAHVEENRVRGSYNKAEYIEPRRVMMQEWADFLDELTGRSKGDNVKGAKFGQA